MLSVLQHLASKISYGSKIKIAKFAKISYRTSRVKFFTKTIMSVNVQLQLKQPVYQHHEMRETFITLHPTSYITPPNNYAYNLYTVLELIFVIMYCCHQQIRVITYCCHQQIRVITYFCHQQIRVITYCCHQQIQVIKSSFPSFLSRFFI